MDEVIIKADKAVIRQQNNTILKDVSLDIHAGEFVYIIGKVGSGKSSFLKTLYAELPLPYGTIEVAGFNLKKIKRSQIPLLRRKCGIVFQDFKLLTDRNVYANLEFVLKATGWKNKKSIKERIELVLNKVDMKDKRDKMPHELSGGEQQRIVLARALLNSPPLILADEPTGNIDPETSYKLIELLKDICNAGKTVIIATHQYDLIEKFPGRVFRCNEGNIKEDMELSVQRHTLTPTAIESIESSNAEEEILPDVISSDIQDGLPLEGTQLLTRVPDAEYNLNEDIDEFQYSETGEIIGLEEEMGIGDIKKLFSKNKGTPVIQKDEEEPETFRFELIDE
ncbi:MAG: ATP-binding cassette domain-containing protein [Culturomica sp.]|jgi:cell division transport system ATP-binding protein|nr:ATP-binding cassette domain-containing protein [Culturomica sp.]